MTSKLTREKVQWLHDAAEEAAAAGIKLTMNPNELLMFTSYALAAMDSEPVAWTDKEELSDLKRDGYAAMLSVARQDCEHADPRRQILLFTHPAPSRQRDQVRNEHAKWSQVTFGDVGPVGPLKHLSKEALEAAAEPGDLSEWADMQFLLWDAQRRAGITDEQITKAMIEKLAVNKARVWPEPKDGEPRLHIKEQAAPVVPEDNDELARLAEKFGAEVAWANEPNEFHHLIEFTPPQFRAAMLQAGTLTNEDTRQVDELTMWVKRLVRSLKKASPDSKLHSEAMDYLTTKGLISVGDALR